MSERNYSDDAETNDGRVIVWGLQDLKESLDSLVEQQRIANVIALAGLEMHSPLRHLAIQPDGEYSVDVKDHLKEALNLD